MGNTNIPQFGAADTANSRDTRDGERQLTEDQKRQRDAQPEGGLGSLLPDSVANESQRLVEHADHGKNVIGRSAGEATTSGEKVAAELQPTAADRAALAGHLDTGHSPSDAT
jgi:hypothetical protein